MQQVPRVQWLSLRYVLQAALHGVRLPGIAAKPWDLQAQSPRRVRQDDRARLGSGAERDRRGRRP